MALPEYHSNSVSADVCVGVREQKSALGKWGRTRMGSDGFNRILLFQARRGTPCTSENTKTHDFKGFRPDFNRFLTGL